ncbi:11101_t:CDS:2 [Entrophospora sp. SA101]|nr:11101_t:CDS:2 [Entrophospora sp. SA101]
MDAEKSINLLNELINRSDLDAGVAKSSYGLLETLKIIQNCTSCKKDDIKENDYHELIEIDDVLNGKVLCEDCKEEKIEKLANKLFNMSNELINRRDLTVSISESSNRLIETLKMIQNCTSCKKDNIKEGGYFDVFYRSINEIGNYLIILEKGNHLIIHQLSDKLIEIYDILNENVLCKGCKGEKIEKLTNKLFSSLNKLINRSDLDAGVTNLSDGLLETLNIIQCCTICKKDDIKEDYCFYEFNKLINEIENYLVELEKGNHLIIHQLSDKLIKIDDILNGNVLCEGCKGEKIEKLTNKLFSLLNRLINRSDLDAGVTNLSDGLLETLNTIQSCTSCKKDNIKEKNCFYKFNKSINEIGNYLVTLEKGNHLIINQLDDGLIEIDDILNENVLCKGCKGEKIEKLTNKLFSSLNKLINRSNLDAGVTNLSDGLIETLKMIQYCGTCKRDNIKKDYCFYEFNKSINEIENYLVALEKGSQSIIHQLDDRLVKIDDILNGYILCEVTELLETLKIIKNCTSCKKGNIKEKTCFDVFCRSMNTIENYLVTLEKENHLIINQLDDALIKIDDVLNGKTLKIMQSCISCKKNSIREKYFYEFQKSINEIENYLVELEKGNHLIINQLDEELIEMDDVLNRVVPVVKKDDIEEKHFGKFYRSINEIENYLVELEKEKREQKENDTIIFWLDDALIKIYHVLNGYILCKDDVLNGKVLCEGCKGEKLTNKLFNSLNELVNRSDLMVSITESSNRLIETLKIMQNCTSCKKDNIKEKYFDKFHKSINKIENYLAALEKGNHSIIHQLNDELIEIDDVLNGYILCKGCQQEKMEKLTNKLFNSLNELINRSNLNARVNKSSNELLETLKIIESCISCKKYYIKEVKHFDVFYRSINEIENYLVELEKEKEEQEKRYIINRNKEVALQTITNPPQNLVFESNRHEID